jgi:hypothetical protein
MHDNDGVAIKLCGITASGGSAINACGMSIQ